MSDESSNGTRPKLSFDTGPFKNVIVLGHASVEDYDREAGKAGTCLEDADYNVLYRGTLPEIHDKALPKVKELSGVELAMNESATAKAQARENAAAAKANREPKTVTVHETPVSYFERVKATASPEVWTTIDTAFREVALATLIDASPTKRVGLPPKDCQEKAAELLTRDDAGLQSAIDKITAKVPDVSIETGADGRPDAMSLARALKAFADALRAEALAM